MLDVAFQSQAIGDRWGSVTRRLFKAVRDEAGVYERNRERRFDIQDMGLRFRIHEHFLRKFVSIVAILDCCVEIDEVEKKLDAEGGMSGDKKNDLDAKLLLQRGAREAALVTLHEERAKTRSITGQMEKIAKANFGYGKERPAGAQTPSIAAETPSHN